MFFYLLAGYFLLTSLVTFLAYALDKSAARKETRRTRERTLLIMGLVGGWPGAIVAQHFFRHKTQKTTFRRRFLMTVLLNCAVVGLVLYACGPEKLVLFGIPS